MESNSIKCFNICVCCGILCCIAFVPIAFFFFGILTTVGAFLYVPISAIIGSENTDVFFLCYFFIKLAFAYTPGFFFDILME